jgi:TonB family protein
MGTSTQSALLLLAAVALSIQVAPGQQPTRVSLQPGASPGQLVGKIPLIDPNGIQRDFVPVKGAPYSATEVHERTQTKADGSRVTERQSRKLFRDGQGRERIERSSGSTPFVIEISDPVGGFKFTLDPRNKMARRAGLLVGPSNAVRTAPQIPGPRPAGKTVTESLGTRLIEGVSAIGTLETITSPAGRQGGAPIVSTIETWRSPELGLMLVVKSANPRLGDEETRITNVKRAEPSPELFRPPLDYTVANETPPWKPGAATSMPVPISRPEPKYTQAARAAGIQGAVTLSITVGANGVPRDIRVVKSLDPGLDQKAIEAVGKWRFRPGQMDGQPVGVTFIIQVNFHL